MTVGKLSNLRVRAYLLVRLSNFETIQLNDAKF